MANRLKDITRKHPRLERRDVQRQIGTLGSGNHFIEICLDENQEVWVMLHSGSRGIGNLIGRYFIGRAKRHMENLGRSEERRVGKARRAGRARWRWKIKCKREVDD